VVQLAAFGGVATSVHSRIKREFPPFPAVGTSAEAVAAGSSAIRIVSAAERGRARARREREEEAGN
tara:strand:+ start:623 stop:820 length:198 start_codon:yes stop_codon:yes gene_type:complete